MPFQLRGHEACVRRLGPSWGTRRLATVWFRTVRGDGRIKSTPSSCCRSSLLNGGLTSAASLTLIPASSHTNGKEAAPMGCRHAPGISGPMGKILQQPFPPLPFLPPFFVAMAFGLYSLSPAFYPISLGKSRFLMLATEAPHLSQAPSRIQYLGRHGKAIGHRTAGLPRRTMGHGPDECPDKPVGRLACARQKNEDENRHRHIAAILYTPSSPAPPPSRHPRGCGSSCRRRRTRYRTRRSRGTCSHRRRQHR